MFWLSSRSQLGNMTKIYTMIEVILNKNLYQDKMTFLNKIFTKISIFFLTFIKSLV